MNWLEIQQLLETMQKNMDCPICLEIMKNPVSTVCNHNFCSFCISKFLNTKRYVPCPMCKVLLSRRCLRENSKLKNIIDKVKKLVLAIKTDTGWTYTPPTKNQTVLAHCKRQKVNGTSVKRKISLEDNAEVLDETNIKNTRFGKRRKSTDDKDKDRLCYDSPSSGLTSLDVLNLSTELGLEPCSLDRQGAVSCVTPPAVRNRRERKDKSITKDDSLGKESKPKTVPSGNLRSTLVRSSDIVDDRNQNLEDLVNLTLQIVPTDSLNTDSLTPIPSTSGMAVSHTKEKSRSALISDYEEDSGLEVSRAKNLTGRYNFRSISVACKEPSGSTQRLQTQKQATVLKNLENLTKAFESPRKIDDQTVLDSISQDHHKNIKKTLVSPMKTRSCMKCQSSPDTATGSKSCVVFGDMFTKHVTDSDSYRIVRVELRKKEGLVPETSTRPCSKTCRSQETVSGVNMCSLNTNIENLPKMKISQITKRNKVDLSSRSILDGNDCNNRFVTSADLKKTNSETGPSCTSRKIEKDPFDLIVNAPGQRIGQSVPYSVLVLSSDSEDDTVTVKKSAKEPAFKWSVVPGNLKTYSRKHCSQKNRAKIARWLRLLPSNFNNIEDNPTLDEDVELSVPWPPLSLQESKADQRKEQHSIKDGSVDSGPDVSVSQLENNSRVLGNEEMTKCWKKRSSVKTDDESSPLGNSCQKQSEHIHKINDMNIPLNAHKEKNSNSPRNDEEIDSSRITSEKKPLKIADIQESTLGISDHFSLENISVCGPSLEEEKKKGRFAESKDPLDGETLPENINPFEFTESPKDVKQRRCHKRKKAKKSASKMPELSFQNRLTRSFQKCLSCKNSATDVLPSAQGAHDQQVAQEGFQDKISTRKEPVPQKPVKLGTQITLGNYTTSFPQEKSIEHLTSEGLKSIEKGNKTGVLPNNVKQSHDSFPDKDNPASSRCTEHSLKGGKPDGMILDVCKSLKGQITSGDDSKLDGRNSDNHKTSRTRKELMEKPPDPKFVEPLATGNDRRKSGQRRRSRRPSKANDKISEELEILELVNQISSAEEYNLLFNSQDVCHSFDVSVDNQAVSNSDCNAKCDKSNDSCNRLSNRPGESDNVTCSVTVSIENKISHEDIRKVQNNSNENGIMIKDLCNTKDTNIILQGSIGSTCYNNEENDKSLSITAGKNNYCENSNISADGTTDAKKLTSECGQKTCSKHRQNKDDGTKDKFIKPTKISALRRSNLSELGIESLKKDPQVSASSSSPTSLERSKLVDAKTIMLVSSASNLLQGKNFNSEEFLEAPPSLKDSQSEQLGTRGTFSHRAIDLVPSVACPEKLHSGSRIQADNQMVTTADLNMNTRKSESTNSELEKCPRTVTIDGKNVTIINSVPLLLFQEQLKNCQKSEQCRDQLGTPVVNANGMDAINRLNAQDLGSVLQASKNANVCNTEVPITPTVIPESPFSDVSASNPGKNAMGTPALQYAEQRNRVVRFSNQVSFIYRPQNLDKKEEEDGKGMNPGFSLSVEKVRSLQNSGSADLERSSRYLRECDGDEPKTDDLNSERLAIGSKLNGFSDVGDKHSNLCMSNTERQTLTDCTSQPPEIQDGEEGLTIKDGKNEGYNQKKAEESDKDTVNISQTAESILGQKSNLRFCGPTLSSVADNSELIWEECVYVSTQPSESSSQRWMNEDLLPLAETTANQIQDPSKAATITEKGSENPDINGDSFTASQQPLPVKMSKEHPSVQDQDKRTQSFVTHQYVAHLPGNYHHLNDNYPFKDQRGTKAEKAMAIDEYSESHSSGTEDLDINPDPSEFELPNLAIQPETVKKLLSDNGTTHLTKNGSERFDVSATELDKTNENPKIPTNLDDQNCINMEPSNQNLENFPMLTRSKTPVGVKLSIPSPDSHIKNSLKKKSSVKKIAKLSSPSSQENTESLILEAESIVRSDQMASSVPSEVSSGHSSLRQNMGSQDEKLCKSLVSPCQILCYSPEAITKESPKTRELSSRPREPEEPISKASNSNVQVLPNVRLVDYDISQSSLISETDSDSATSFTQIVRRRTRSSCRLQNQLPKSPKTCKSELKKSFQKAKLTNSNFLKDSKQDPAGHGECSKDEILPPDLEKELTALKKPESLMPADSWLTMTDNLDSMPILKSQSSTQSKTNGSASEELVLPKSGIAEKEVKNLTITESENFSLSSSERKFLRSGLCETEEFTDKVEIKDQSATLNRKETDDANLTMEEAAISSKGKTEALADCLSGNLDFVDFGKVAKSASQDVNSLAPSLAQSSESTIDEYSLSENTLEPTQLSFPNPLKSVNQFDFVLENQDNGAISKKRSVLPSETVKNDSLRVDIPDTEIVDVAPIMSLTDFIIPDSVEYIPADQKELQNGNIPKLLTSNKNVSQNSSSSYVPCSVEQDDTLAHVLEAFREVYTRNHNTTLSEIVCDGAGSQSKNSIKRITNDIPENSKKNSQRSMSLITEDAVEKTSEPCRIGDERCDGDEMVLRSDNVQDNPQPVGGDIIKESPLCSYPASTASSTISNTSKIAFSTECHLMIDSQNFISVKRSKRKCFALGGSVQESPPKSRDGNETAKSCASSVANAKSLDVKSVTKGLSLSPTVTEISCQARKNSPARLDELEKDEDRKFQDTFRISLQENSVLKEGSSFESCVLLSVSEIEEFAQAVTKDDSSVYHPKQNHQFLEVQQVHQPGSAPDEQSLGLVSKRTRSGKKSSKPPNLTDNTLTGLSPKSGNKNGGSNSCIEEPANSQQSVSSWSSSANENCRLRSSPRLRGRNKAVAKKQNEKKSLERANQESVSSKHKDLQKKFPLKNSDSSKMEPEPLDPSQTDSDTQQPSCPFSSAEDLEVENAVISDTVDDDDTANTQAPSLDLSEPDRITDSPHGEPVEQMLELESDWLEPQEFPKKNENNFDREEFVEKEDAKDEDAENVLELSNKKEDKLQDDSQDAALSSASTKCPSIFSDNSVSAPSSQMVLSNPVDNETAERDRSKNISQKSKIRSGQKVTHQDGKMESSGRKVTSPDDDTTNVTELSKIRIKEKSVGDGFAVAENNKQLTTELKNGQSQDKVDLMDDIDFSLPDLPASFPQGFYPETNADEGHIKASIQQKHPEEVSDTAETSPDKEHSEDKHLESNSAEESSQELTDKERETTKNQISNSDTKQAFQANSCAVNEDAVIVIDKFASGQGMATELEILDVQTASSQSKDPVIIVQAEVETGNGQTMASAENPVDKHLSDKGDITGGEQSKDEEIEDSEEVLLQHRKRRCQVIKDDSDDDDEKVEIINVESASASSSNALSMQSEKFSTQQCTHLEQDLEEMKKQIAQLEARLGLNDSAVDTSSEEEDVVELQEVKEEQGLPTLAEQDLPPEADYKISKLVTKGKACDQKYTRISSSDDDDDDDDDLHRKVIPDSEPDEKNVEQSTSTIFPVRNDAVTDLHSSGEESEDLFCTPGSPISLLQLPALHLSRHRQPRKAAEERPTGSPVSKNQGKNLEAKRKKSRKNGTKRSSRLRIASSSSEDDVEVVAKESPRYKVLHAKAKSKENKQAQMSEISENKKEDNLKNLEESPCGSNASSQNSPRSPRNHPRTLPKAKATPQNESSSLVLKELSFTNTRETTVMSPPLLSQSPGCRVKDPQPKKTKCFMATGLSNIEVNHIKKLASMIGGQFSSKFSREVTHVIVKTVSENVRYCDRTLKYFQGIANKSWILSYKWIQESLEEKRLLKEDPYEIIGDSVNGFAHRGPTRARLTHAPLFKQFEIHVVGESSELPHDELRSLIEMAGGRIVADPEEFSSNPCITCLAIGGSTQSLKDFRRLKSQMKIYNILLVSREWILDSVAMFRVQPLEGYIQLS